MSKTDCKKCRLREDGLIKLTKEGYLYKGDYDQKCDFYPLIYYNLSIIMDWEGMQFYQSNDDMTPAIVEVDTESSGYPTHLLAYPCWGACIMEQIVKWWRGYWPPECADTDIKYMHTWLKDFKERRHGKWRLKPGRKVEYIPARPKGEIVRLEKRKAKKR